MYFEPLFTGCLSVPFLWMWCPRNTLREFHQIWKIEKVHSDSRTNWWGLRRRGHCDLTWHFFILHVLQDKMMKWWLYIQTVPSKHSAKNVLLFNTTFQGSNSSKRHSVLGLGDVALYCNTRNTFKNLIFINNLIIGYTGYIPNIVGMTTGTVLTK